MKKLIILGIVVILFFSLGCIEGGNNDNYSPNLPVVNPVCGNGKVESGETKLTCCEDVGCGEYEKCEGSSCISILTVSKEQAIAQAKSQSNFMISSSMGLWTGFIVNNATLIERSDGLYWEIELYPYKQDYNGRTITQIGFVSDIKAFNKTVEGTDAVESSANENETISDEDIIIPPENLGVTGCTGSVGFDCSQCVVSEGEEVSAQERYSCTKTTQCDQNCEITTWAVCDMGMSSCCMPKLTCEEIIDENACISMGCTYVK